MTIKIENIPEGQKIKSINFNIDFESGESKTYVKLPVEEYTNAVEPSIFTPLKTKSTGIDDPNVAPVNIEKREPKEIPPEMLDAEF